MFFCGQHAFAHANRWPVNENLYADAALAEPTEEHGLRDEAATVDHELAVPGPRGTGGLEELWWHTFGLRGEGGLGEL